MLIEKKVIAQRDQLPTAPFSTPSFSVHKQMAPSGGPATAGGIGSLLVPPVLFIDLRFQKLPTIIQADIKSSQENYGPNADWPSAYNL